MFRIFISTICIVILISACTTTNKADSTNSKKEEKTAFYEFNFVFDTIQKKSLITLNSVKVVDTKINYQPEAQKLNLPNNIYFEIIDKGKNSIKDYEEHPLFRRVDVYSENGNIESKLLSLLKCSLTIRVPYYQPYESIIITETKENLKNKTIIKN